MATEETRIYERRRWWKRGLGNLEGRRDSSRREYTKRHMLVIRSSSLVSIHHNTHNTSSQHPVTWTFNSSKQSAVGINKSACPFPSVHPHAAFRPPKEAVTWLAVCPLQQ